jgi:hypothetical protein
MGDEHGLCASRHSMQCCDESNTAYFFWPCGQQISIAAPKTFGSESVHAWSVWGKAARWGADRHCWPVTGRFRVHIVPVRWAVSLPGVTG